MMKSLQIGSMVVSCTCVVSAAVLCYRDAFGWGWFLFIGLVMFCVPFAGTNDAR